MKKVLSLHPNSVSMKKYYLYLIIIAALLLVMTVLVRFVFAPQMIMERTMQKAGKEMEYSLTIAMVKTEAEAAAILMRDEAKRSLESPDSLAKIVITMVRNQKHITGAGIAFKPDYYYTEATKKDRYYAPYAYKAIDGSKASNPQVTYELLSFDYTRREWYQIVMEGDSSGWSKPYMDLGGSNIMMRTYAIPLKNPKGEKIGVVFADVPLTELSNLANSIMADLRSVSVFLLLFEIIAYVLVVFIIWSSIKAYKEMQKLLNENDPTEMTSKLEKLKEVNNSLVQRNIEQAKELAELKSKKGRYQR